MLCTKLVYEFITLLLYFLCMDRIKVENDGRDSLWLFINTLCSDSVGRILKAVILNQHTVLN